MLEKTIGSFALQVTLIAATLLSTVVASIAAQSKPLSAAELAFYQGADREKILLDGAKKDGEVTFYT